MTQSKKPKRPAKKKAPAKKKSQAKPKAKAKSAASRGAKKPAKKKARASKGAPVSRQAVLLQAVREKLASGTIAAKLKFLFKWGTIAAVVLMLLFLVVSISWVALYRVVNPPVTPLMIQRHFGHGADIQKEWRSLEEMAPHFPLAVLAAEDQRFFNHNGFDIKEIKKAVADHLEGERLRGASTLSQQVAKNVFLWPARSWIRKGMELYFTVLVETFWSKERILEVYVNVTEMGEGIYGAERAANAYFNKSAKALSREESALIAAVLPNPREMSPVHPSAKVLRRQAWILQQMKNLGSIAYLQSVAP